MALRCKHCGSPNHMGWDCDKPHLTWVPAVDTPPEDQKPLESQPSPELGVPSEADNPPKAPAPGPALDPPRWKGGPKICTFENLPAFPSEKALARYMAARCPGSPDRVWQCPACNQFHFSVKSPLAQYPKGWKLRRRPAADPEPESRMSAYEAEVVQPVLPQREVKAPAASPRLPAKKPLASKPPRKVKSNPAQPNLF